ncbi:hypothetical protein FHS21_000149 [Phyllobacterium trifolii]|uniref:Uncharacterized protein n=1 Tax=Phyllobacterium trifolii TaxID=300193 RepID=A0A839TYV6_9HYPH|nr:hypothetical protein [Phyllobacterium trifolii]
MAWLTWTMSPHRSKKFCRIYKSDIISSKELTFHGDSFKYGANSLGNIKRSAPIR